MKTFLSLLLLFCCTLLAYAQQEVSFRVLWYNTENTFDCENNPATDDDEFLPAGNRHWTPKRYYHKLRQLAKVINAAGEWDTPALVGLCEVENDSVLTHLLTRTPLRRQEYRYCMTTGSDTRGIQLALLYQRDKFAYKGHNSYPVRSPRKHHRPTRDILHVWGTIATGDTLDVLLCHFPSRYGGEKETENHRLDAARTLRSLCDSLYTIRSTPQLLLMGDFNDFPTDKSIRQVLAAQPFPFHQPDSGDEHEKSLILYNLFADPIRFPFAGSHKYQGEWSQLDQIIVSANLSNPTHPMRLQPASIRLFAPPFLLTTDKTWRGLRPKRTYYGYTYEGGFSDHLPLSVDWLIHTPTAPPTQQPSNPPFDK